MEVSFGAGSIVYRETIAAPVEGVGHFEPLRHYAEVHLLLEPGSGAAACRLAPPAPTDQLDRNWQRLILTHLVEKEHLGVLTGSPITDMKITLVAGRAHVKHTEGGDFRQATYRAVRQGLMQAESILLEPWYDFRLELPAASVGRAMSDIQRMGGEAAAPESQGEEAVLTGGAPVAGLRDYADSGGRLYQGPGPACSAPLGATDPAADQADVVSALGYDPERDMDNPADSVFCAHGAGVTVKWDQVRSPHACGQRPAPGRGGGASSRAACSVRRSGRLGGLTGAGQGADGHLRAHLRQGGAPRAFQPQKKPAPAPAWMRRSTASGHAKPGPEYLLVDGYNIIFAWEELERLARQDVAAAREALEDILSNYQGFRKCVVILVFDAYKVKGNPGSVERRQRDLRGVHQGGGDSGRLYREDHL